MGFSGRGLEGSVPESVLAGFGELCPLGKAHTASKGYMGDNCEDVPDLRSRSARCNGCGRGESGEGGLLGEDWVIVS